ncbi:MAG: acetyl-CoA carboxylase biotin carboxylase subunit [Acidobacteria bacterium]|nr:acetyl-CoA carboxylase biotin carboxylase subunit [Acidobacteriota bacterium]
MSRALSTVLVANRGEIAVRIISTIREMGLRAVAVYSEADSLARHVEIADEAIRIGPAPASRSYLNIDAILDAARRTGADAVHPGYGFLSENPGFVESCEAAGLTFIGPSAETMRLAGSKLGARQVLETAGVPVIPGSQQPLLELEAARQVADVVGYPLMLKASAGGGGRGMRVIDGPETLASEFPMARAEARAAFGDPTLYMERLIVGARHVEVQVLGDGKGGAVHLGERNCSIQRRHQKMLEEAPSPCLSRATAAQLHDAACRAVTALRYRNAGTVEFLVDAAGRCYFMEINARLQVEHPVTEEITGIDLVRAQITIAQTGELPFTQEDIQPRGHAMECRINAEDPAAGFLPQPGTVERLRLPCGFGVRFDTYLYQGGIVPLYYDSLVGKLIVRGPSREAVLATMDRALEQFEAFPLATTAPFLRQVLQAPAFRRGDYTLACLDELLPPASPDEDAAEDEP